MGVVMTICTAILIRDRTVVACLDASVEFKNTHYEAVRYVHGGPPRGEPGVNDGGIGLGDVSPDSLLVVSRLHLLCAVLL
jgi:hypothetical protein